jgi:hypothetical protein
MIRSPAAKQRKAKDKIEALPFVTYGSTREKPSKWSVSATNKVADLADEERLGADYAHLALEAMAAEDFTPLLGQIVLDMGRRPRTERVIIGFMLVISEYAVAHYKERGRQRAA